MQMQEEYMKVELEAENTTNTIRKQQSASLLALTTNQEDDLKNARDLWKKDMEQERAAFETERRRRAQGYNKELGELREAESDRLKRAGKEHEDQMALLQRQKQGAVGQRQERMTEDMENWQRERLARLRDEQGRKDDCSRKALRERSQAELGMVLAKLDSQASEEKSGIDEAAEGRRESYLALLGKEEGRLVEEEQGFMGRFAVEHENAQLLREEVSRVHTERERGFLSPVYVLRLTARRTPSRPSARSLAEDRARNGGTRLELGFRSPASALPALQSSPR